MTADGNEECKLGRGVEQDRYPNWIQAFQTHSAEQVCKTYIHTHARTCSEELNLPCPQEKHEKANRCCMP